VPDYRNSTVQTLEFGLAFRKHHTDQDYLLHGACRRYFYLLCNYSQNYLLIKISSLPHKKIPNTFSFPTVQLFAVAVHRVFHDFRA
jgi:hypothetical protein